MQSVIRSPCRAWARAIVPLLVWSACVHCQSHGERSGPEVLQQLQLVDQDGERIDEDALSDRVVVLNFMFTRCPSVCPRLTQVLREAFDGLPEETQRHVQFLSISVDPVHDRPATLKAFARKHRADRETWRFAHIEERELSALAERLAVFEPGARKEPSAHSMVIYLFDRQGRPRQRYTGTTLEPQHLTREIMALVALERSSKS